MKAFALTDFERPPAVTGVPMPEAGPGQVLVRVHAASVNGFDLAVAGGMLKGMMEYVFPVLLGKDFAGTVEAVGSGATQFAAGDQVFGVISDPSFLNTRSFAEYVAVPEGPHLPRPWPASIRSPRRPVQPSLSAARRAEWEPTPSNSPQDSAPP